jgi:hypothetical protein
VRLVFLLLLVVSTPAPAAPAEQFLASVTVGGRGAGEVCLSGSKAPGAHLLFRVEVWHGAARVGAVEVPDQDPRGRFSQCRTIPPAERGDVVKLFAVGAERSAQITFVVRPITQD